MENLLLNKSKHAVLNSPVFSNEAPPETKATMTSDWFDLPNIQIFKCTLRQCLVQTDDLHLTLPLEILPVHLPAQPAWTPGPGIFHYGTAEGRSRPAKEKKRTRVRH